MLRVRLLILACSLAFAHAATAADEPKWVTIKGKVAWEGPVPPQPEIVPKTDPQVCTKCPGGLQEDFIINPTNHGLKDVFVWIRPQGATRKDLFPENKIHPSLLKVAKAEAEIDQPCCKFVPHVLGVRAGQKLFIKNSAPVAHNTKWGSNENGSFNPIIEPGKKFELPNSMVFEPGGIRISCNIHTWMTGYLRVYDHPYYAVTDADGQFEIKLAPTGNFSLLVEHPIHGFRNGRKGAKGPAITLNGDLDLGTLKMVEFKESEQK